MLEVQKFLGEFQGDSTEVLEGLKAFVGVEYKFHPTLPLVILDYCQINCPKLHPIVRECRGLVLEVGTWKVVAKGFDRFFNLGEALELTDNFDWNNFSARTKEDGSYIMLFNYNGEWLVKTRNSFADGKLQDSNVTWKELFLQTLKSDKWETFLDEEEVGIFELCSTYNKVVRHYTEPQSFLLGVYNRQTSQIEQWSDELATKMFGVKVPREYKFYDKEDFLGFYTWIQSLSKIDIDQLSRVL